MSSATSTDSSPSLGAGAAAGDSPAFRPWQFFLLCGMLAATAAVVVATGQSPASIVLLSLTVVAASFVGLAVYRSVAPLVSPESAHAPALVAGRTRAALEREKTLVLRSIKELEFDYAMKKVSQADFEEMRARLRGRALGLMRQLEAGRRYRSEIEAELSKRLGMAARREDSGASLSDTVKCTSCDAANDADARFCKRCGAKIERSG